MNLTFTLPTTTGFGILIKNPVRRVISIALFTPILACADAMTPAAGNSGRNGEDIYNYYCYQCHGYSGNAKTQAGIYLDPKPIDFTAVDQNILTRQRMIETVTSGRSGTAMVSFSTVLNPEEIDAVVDYIRDRYMSGHPVSEKYHTPENGWPDHERYADAFPFITGELPADTPWEQLDENQYNGKRLYYSSCVSCHDAANADSLVWEIRAVSYPRKHYSHKLDWPDAYTGASVHKLHEQNKTVANMTAKEARGMQYYLDNCAFCHAPDGTSRNWIGSFLSNRPRDFTANSFIGKSSDEYLRQIIRNGVTGTSMPAWKNVLSGDQIDDIISYMRAAFGEQPLAGNNPK